MTREELFERMQNIVDEKVVSYKSDFDIDREVIEEWGDEPYWGVWVVRSSGTELKRFTDDILPMQYIDAVCDNMSIQALYYINHRGGDYKLRLTDRGEIRKKYRELDKYDIEVFATADYQHKMSELMGCFSSEEKAKECGEKLMKNMDGKAFRVTYRRR